MPVVDEKQGYETTPKRALETIEDYYENVSDEEFVEDVRSAVNDHHRTLPCLRRRPKRPNVCPQARKVSLTE